MKKFVAVVKGIALVFLAMVIFGSVYVASIIGGIVLVVGGVILLITEYYRDSPTDKDKE